MQNDEGDDWAFDDGPSAETVGPAATAVTATPAGADQPAQPAQSDPRADSGLHPAARPGRTILPKPDVGGVADDDPLTSPRYARDGRSEPTLRRYRPDWLAAQEGPTKPTPSPGHGPGQTAQPAPSGTEQLPRRTRQRVQAEPTSQPVQPSTVAAAGSAEAAAAQSIPAVPGPPTGSELAQPGGTQSAEPAARSIWEPITRSQPDTADPPTGAAGYYVGPSIKTGPSAWQTTPPPRPSSWQQGEAAALSPEAAGPPAAAETSAAEDVQQGSDGLPKRQPMTHLAAPLRRSWPASDPGEEASGGPQPSVWDTWRPTAGVRRAAQEDESDSGDGQA